VIGLGQEVLARKTNKRPYFIVMSSFMPRVRGPLR
jgi:hypothetical protein